MATSFIKLNIAVIGGGNGGLSAAVSLRRAGHTVTIYERRDYAGEIGAGIGIPSNGSKWLHKWGVNTDAGRPVVATKLLIHEWNTGKVLANAPLGNYREKFGYDTLMFQRCDLHRVLLDAALSQDGAGTPCKHVTDHLALSVDTEKGQVTFANGTSVVADLVIAADGIHSRLRAAMGIVPEVQQAASCAYRHVISMDKVKELGIESIGSNGALEYWNGPGANKIVIGSCHGGEVLGIYSFFPLENPSSVPDGWNESISPQQLVETFPNLDQRVRQIMLHSEDIKIWRLFTHKPYPYWTRGRVALLGDAAHPMFPDQTQGTSQAIEDAAALGLVFSRQYFGVNGNQSIDYAVELALQRYEKVRMSRATELQSASARAREDLRERIGWKAEGVKPGKLTIEDVCGYDMEKHLSEVVSVK